MSSIHPSFRSYVIAGLILCSRIPASGAVWDGESSASWSTPINWGANLEPGSGDVAQFPLAIPGTGATITLSAGELASSLLFQGAYTLTLGDITLTTGNISVDPSIIATVNSAIGGSAGLTKLGGGTLVLGGTNTFTGAVAVNAGTLSVAADSNFGVAANAVTLAGSTLQGASFTAARNVTVSGGVSINATAGNFFGISGNLGGSGALTFAGPGTVTLSGAAGTYTGAAQVTAGTLQLNAPNALGADGATLSVNTGGTLAVSSTAALKHALTLNGGTWKGNFTTTTWAGPVTVSGATNNVVVSDSFNTQNILLNEAVAGAGELIVSGNVFSRGLLSFGSTLTSNAGLTSTISIGHGATVENAARFSGA
ncbi:MAG TPA: autotransporter-associated beta strand repeat-containing protein, partial [Chthoniobacteraceae bacterium]|nr:autotransporter-associated beta strand repeat-containing protein [Chthoniobacteraceae bacterium]